MKHNEMKRQQIEMLSEVMGCIILLVFAELLGNSGMAYLGIACLSIGVIQTLFFGGAQEGLCKMLKARQAKGQYRNVAVTQRRILILQGILSILATAVFVMGAGILAEKVFQMHYSTVLIRILAVSLCFRGFSSVMIGSLQAEDKEGMTTLIPPIRQLLVLVFGLIFANRLGDYGRKVSALLGNEAYRAMYAGAGVAIAVCVVEIILFLFVCVAFMTKRRIYKGDSEEGMKQVDSLFGTFRSFYGAVWMPMLFRLFPVLVLWLGMFFYHKNEPDAALFAERFGVLCGRFLPMCGIPLLIICIVLQMKYLRKIRLARNSYQKGLRMAVVSALYFAMYFAVMSGQLTDMLGGSKNLGEMFAYGSSLILLVLLFFYFSRLLFMFEKKNVLPWVYGLLTIVFVIASTLGLKGGNIMALIYAGIIALAIGTVLLGFLCSKFLHVRVDWLRTFAIPIVIVAAIGLLCMLLGKIFTPHLGNFITVLVSLLISGILYWLLYKKTSFY